MYIHSLHNRSNLRILSKFLVAAATLDLASTEAMFSVFPPSSSNIPTRCDHVLLYELTNCTITTSNESYWCGEICVNNLFDFWLSNKDLCQSLMSRPGKLITGFIANVDEVLEKCPDKVLELSFDMIPEGEPRPVPSNIQVTFESITPTTVFITPASTISIDTTATTTVDEITTDTTDIVSSDIEDNTISTRYSLFRVAYISKFIAIFITLLG